MAGRVFRPAAWAALACEEGRFLAPPEHFWPSGELRKLISDGGTSGQMRGCLPRSPELRDLSRLLCGLWAACGQPADCHASPLSAPVRVSPCASGSGPPSCSASPRVPLGLRGPHAESPLQRAHRSPRLLPAGQGACRALGAPSRGPGNGNALSRDPGGQTPVIRVHRDGVRRALGPWLARPPGVSVVTWPMPAACAWREGAASQPSGVSPPEDAATGPCPHGLA